MGLREKLGIKFAVIGDDGRAHCHNCTADLTGQPAGKKAGEPVRCPMCRAKNFPDLRGSSPLYRSR